MYVSSSPANASMANNNLNIILKVVTDEKLVGYPLEVGNNLSNAEI